MGTPRNGSKIPLSGMILMRCDNCKLVFNDQHAFCLKCGKKLIPEQTSVYANIVRSKATSFVYELESGISIKVKANTRIHLDKGAHYSTKPN